MNAFINSLDAALSREIESVRIVSLYGDEMVCCSAREGIRLLGLYDLAAERELRHCRFEILIRFKNGNKIDGTFHTKQSAMEFLRAYE